MKDHKPGYWKDWYWNKGGREKVQQKRKLRECNITNTNNQMTQKDKIMEARMFAQRVRSIASSILDEGNGYDMKWHKGYCDVLMTAADSLLKKLK